MKFYHATDRKNLGPILIDGIKPGVDGYVYLCKEPIDAVKFVFIRGVQDIIVFEVNLKENEVEETFDHSEAFFKCKAYGATKTISPTKIKNVYDYSIKE